MLKLITNSGSMTKTGTFIQGVPNPDGHPEGKREKYALQCQQLATFPEFLQRVYLKYLTREL